MFLPLDWYPCKWCSTCRPSFSRTPPKKVRKQCKNNSQCCFCHPRSIYLPKIAPPSLRESATSCISLLTSLASSSKWLYASSKSLKTACNKDFYWDLSNRETKPLKVPSPAPPLKKGQKALTTPENNWHFVPFWEERKYFKNLKGTPQTQRNG